MIGAPQAVRGVFFVELRDYLKGIAFTAAEKTPGTGSPPRSPRSAAAPRTVPSRLTWVVCLLCFVLLGVLPGCSCRKSTPQQDAKKKEPEKPRIKPDFEPTLMQALPSDADELRNFSKPGHWTQVVFELKANNFDFVGQLRTNCVDKNGTAIPVERSAYFFDVSRRLSLPKAQTKFVQQFVYVPRTTLGARSVQIQQYLEEGNTGRKTIVGIEPTSFLLPHQYQLVVLANSPERYGFLQKMPSLSPPKGEWAAGTETRDYIVVLPDVSRKWVVPSQWFAWTTTALLVWDDMPAQTIDQEQQQAILDWLHWGGQIVINTPATVDWLENSFLAPWLPAKIGKTDKLTIDAAKKLEKFWTPSDVSKDFANQLRLKAGIEVVELMPTVEGKYIPNTQELFAERRVGRGRIIMSSLSMSNPSFVKWRNYDAVLNAVILRRPPRRFRTSNEGFLRAEFLDGGRPVDSLVGTSRLHYFSRDAAGPDAMGMGQMPLVRNETDMEANVVEKRNSTYIARSDQLSGNAGWNDYSHVAQAARTGLDQAGGISVPSQKFVGRILAIYLACLVPVNWAIFRGLRRIEWAWFAVPVIALVGTFAVVRLAQLDIGFARSRTELAIVELHSDYDRAHVTRYTGLYTSLSTTYRLQFDDRSGIALPFSEDLDGEQLRKRSTHVAHLLEKDQRELDGMAVLSNSTGYVHAEHMVTLPGGVRLSGDDWSEMRLSNNTGSAWHDAQVVGKLDGEYRVSKAAKLNDGDTVRLQFHRAAGGSGSGPTADEFGTVALTAMGTAAAGLGEGEFRLIAWNQESVEGVVFRPVASQEQVRTLVVAHLRPAILPEPQPDVNLYLEKKAQELEPYSDEP